MQNTMKQKRWTIMLSIFMVVALLAGCGSKDEGSDKAAEQGQAVDSGTITMWGWNKAFYEPTVEAFSKKYPDIKINFVEVAAKDYLKKIQTSVAAGGDLPDIIWGEAGFRGALFALNILDDLESAPYNFDKSLLLDSVVPQLQNDAGKLVSLQWSVSPGAMAYKRDLAKQYFGTDDPEKLAAMLPNWDTFIAKGKELKEKSGGKTSMLAGMMDAYTIVYPQYPEQFIKGDEVDTQAVTSIFTTLENIRNADITAKLDMWSPTWNASYAQDNVLFYPAANWTPEFVIQPNDKNSDGRWGLMLPPDGAYSYGGTSLGIWKDSKNKGISWKFLEWFAASKEGGDLNMKIDESLVPLKSLFEDQTIFSSGADSYYGGQDLGLFWTEKVLPTMKSNPYTRFDQDIYNASSLAMQTFTKDPSYHAGQALENWKKELQKNHPEIQFK
ncbi:extracellular solute-binding protein [Paenibacillus sp. LS1]|uniref:ABC transporter substrate-binding protein n=1 Tax=Paenibacillus sp. LS1 TaxID=2992120 RepID=UPI0022323C84|nr:extracellular solute-binding protein [Paenibacillus sp. LS1]MCW3790231.1 extracellular solute-binding protein [Paenibacillus sp. LS1]